MVPCSEQLDTQRSLRGFLIEFRSFCWGKQGVGARFMWKLQQIEKWIDPEINSINSFQLQSYPGEVCAAL